MKLPGLKRYRAECEAGGMPAPRAIASNLTTDKADRVEALAALGQKSLEDRNAPDDLKRALLADINRQIEAASK